MKVDVRKKQLSQEGELRFAAEFIKRGWYVFLPFGEDSPVDLLIQKENTLKRVQVKSTKIISGTVRAKLRSTNNWQNRKYTSIDVDLIAVYDYVNTKGYLLDIKEFEGMTEVCLRVSPPKNKQKLKIRDGNKYLFFE